MSDDGFHPTPHLRIRRGKPGEVIPAHFGLEQMWIKRADAYPGQDVTEWRPVPVVEDQDG